MKTQNKTNKTKQTMKNQIAPASEKATNVAQNKSNKVAQSNNKVISNSFLIPTEDKISYNEKRKAFVNAYKDEIGGLTAMIKFALTNTKGIEYVNCFVDFNKNHWVNPNNPKDLKIGLDNIKSIMPQEIRFLTQRIDNETIVCFDKDGKEMLRPRFSITQFEKCFKLFYENLAKQKEIAKAKNVKQTKGAKAPVVNQISNSKKVKA